MENVLKISDLRVAYPHGAGKEKVILDKLNLEINRGEIFGLLGPNGAGKTTLIKSIIGLINTKSGEIFVFGENSFSKSARCRLGYMPEIANFYWYMTPKEILSMFGELSGMSKHLLEEAINHTLDLVGLKIQKNELVKNFSKGMGVRLNMAQALLHKSELLILDEPFSGLDPLGRIDIRNILKTLRDEGRTILLSSHELSEAELICDTICIMREGKVLKHGPLKRLVEEKGEHSLENYFIKMIA